MYGYAGSSAAATALTPFTSPDQNTNAGGTASQAAAVGQATGTSAGDAQSIVSNVSQTLSAVPAALQSASTGAATGAQSTSLSDLLGLASDLITIFAGVPASLSTIPDIGLGLLAIIDLPFAVGGYLYGANTDKFISAWNGEEQWPSTAPAPVLEFPATLSNLPAGTVPVSAGLGQANMVGGLSVPSNWTVAAPEIRSVAMTSPLTNAAATAAPAMEAGSASTFNQMGLAGMSGQAMAGPPAAGDSQGNGKAITHARLTARGPGAAGDGEAEASPAPRTVVTGVAAAIREITKLRNEGRLTDQEYKEQKKRLLEVSIRHRPLG